MICEIITFFFNVMLALFAAFMAFKFIPAKHKEKPWKHPPSVQYFEYRIEVKMKLNTKQSDGHTLMEDILTNLSDMLSAEFDNEEGKDTAKEKKIKLTCIMKILMNEIVSDIENPQMVKDFKKALLFETFSKIIASPLDIIGRRNASRLEEIIHNSPQTQVQTVFSHILEILNTFLGKVQETECSRCFQQLRILKPVKTCFKIVTEANLISIISIAVTLFFYLYDYIISAQVITIYACRFFSLIYPQNCAVVIICGEASTNYTPPHHWMYLTVNDTDTYEDTYFVMQRNIAYNFLSSSIPMAIVLIGSILSAAKISFSPGVVENRFNLVLAESSVDWTLQLCAQSSVYMSNAWVLVWLENKVTESEEPGDPLGFHALWMLVAWSLASQSFGEFKRRQILHEYSDGMGKKILYMLASMHNSVFTSLLVVSCGTAAFDIMTAWPMSDMFGMDIGTGYLVLTFTFYGLYYFSMFVLVFVFCNYLHLPTATTTPDITTASSHGYYAGLGRQCVTVCVISLLTAASNALLIIFYSLWCGHTLVMFEEKLASYAGHNITIDSYSDIWPSESTTWNSRKVFTIVSTIGIPLSWFGSYLFTQLYLKTSSVEMGYENEQWIDLNTGTNSFFDATDVDNFVNQSTKRTFEEVKNDAEDIISYKDTSKEQQGSLNQRGGSDIGITVEGEGEPNEEECGPDEEEGGPDEEEGDPDAIRALSEDDEESDSQFPNDITADKFSIVKEVKESFAYWQDKDEEPHNHRILHILRHSYGTFRNKYEVLLDA